MCFEVILPILLALFAVFGGGSLFFFIWETWFVSDNISVFVEVDTDEAAKNVAQYLREAGKVPLAKGNGVTVLVRRAYAEDALLRYLKRKKISYHIVDDMENKAR